MILLASTTDTGAGSFTSTAVRLSERTRSAEVLLNVTAAAAAANDTLDVYVQASVDGGSTWDDFIHFTQVLGNGGAKKYLARWQGEVAPTTALAAPGDATLAAGVAQGPHGLLWRVKRVVASGTGAVFTLSVQAGGLVVRDLNN